MLTGSEEICCMCVHMLILNKLIFSLHNKDIRMDTEEH